MPTKSSSPPAPPGGGSAQSCRPVNRHSTPSSTGSAASSSCQIVIAVTVGPGATTHFFQTGCSSQCAASESASAVRVESSPLTAIAQASTASRAA